jgi:hypothetical protein
MLLRRDDPHALAAKYLFALSKCQRNKHDKKLCARLRALAVIAREIAYRRDVVVSESDFAVICSHRKLAVEAYKEAERAKAFDQYILEEM